MGPLAPQKSNLDRERERERKKETLIQGQRKRHLTSQNTHESAHESTRVLACKCPALQQKQAPKIAPLSGASFLFFAPSGSLLKLHIPLEVGSEPKKASKNGRGGGGYFGELSGHCLCLWLSLRFLYIPLEIGPKPYLSLHAHKHSANTLSAERSQGRIC